MGKGPVGMPFRPCVHEKHRLHPVSYTHLGIFEEFLSWGLGDDAADFEYIGVCLLYTSFLITLFHLISPSPREWAAANKG